MMPRKWIPTGRPRGRPPRRRHSKPLVPVTERTRRRRRDHTLTEGQRQLRLRSAEFCTGELVEEGSPFGGAECEGSSPEHSPLHENMDQGEEQLYPFDNLAVEFYEGPEDGADSNVANIEGVDTAADSADQSEIFEDDRNGNEDSITADSVASDIYDDSVLIKAEPDDSDYKDVQKTYIEDFIYSNTSSFDEGSNSNFDDTKEKNKGPPLSRFPKIVKSVESADYATLQVLYGLLYQRSAWDTQEILIHRILEFSGFTFGQHSEDFYNREFMLKTEQNDVLIKIGAILGLDEVPKSSSDIDKARPELITSIMEFLTRPGRKPRALKIKGDDGVSRPQQMSCGCRSRCFNRFSKAQKKRLLEYAQELDSKKLLDSYLVSLMDCKKIVRKSLPEEDSKKIKKEVYYIYRCKFGKKESIVCKGAFTTLHGIKLARVNQLQIKMKSGQKLPPKIDPKDFPPIVADESEYPDSPRKPVVQRPTPDKNIKKTWVSSEEQIRKMEQELKENINKDMCLPKVVVEKFDVNSIDLINNKLKQDAEKKLKDAENKTSSEKETKLKDFSLVVQSIENASEELLVDVHFLLFLSTAEAGEVKSRILEFSGFTFESDTEEYDERNEFLQRMTFKMVSDVARSFSLETLSSKELTIKNLLTFLTKPDESFLRVTATLPCSLSDVELDDFDDLSDSDVSITCEVVEKKVECIDLLSSGEDSDGEGKPRKEKKSTPKKVPAPPKPNNTSTPLPHATKAPPAPIIKPTITTAASDTQAASSSGGVRSLRNFETICKIVNTHPHEYLVDIYDLLYLKKHEPSTLRDDILNFTGFTFEKGSVDYVKRKQLLDRMLYNSVRRIYNTLIHNTTEVKVFSKPTMITEIFQFLFKLPDHDTSVRPPPTAKSVPKPAVLQTTPVVKNVPSLAGVTPPTNLNLPNQTGKLSDLKRVFQRVACFPCEYLIDVHKLLFMTDCDAKVIRQNIFAFKGFSFSADSQDFQQRKMYLEYLTFHSLRKISSVLTTRSVDLRNSTKHELASHLTQVLTEYCDMDAAETTATSDAVQASVTLNVYPTVSSTTSLISSSTPVENIVVTPIIDPSITNVSTSVEPAKSMVITSVSSVVSNNAATSAPLAISIVDARSVNSPAVTTTTSARGRRKRKTTPTKQSTPPTPEVQTVQSQFADINLPEVEQYRHLYGPNLSNLSIYNPNMPTITGITTHVGGSAISFPVVNAYTQPIQISSTFPRVQPASGQLIRMAQAIPPTIVTQVPNKQTEIIVPGECLVSEPEEPAAKKPKTVSSNNEKNTKKVSSSPEETNSFHNKLNYAMITDDEDCDKPLSSLVGHPIDSVLKKHIVDIVEQTNLASLTINGVIQKIFNMYPKFDLSYRKEFIKSTLRSMLYRLGEQKDSGGGKAEERDTDSPDCSVTTTDNCDSASNDSPKAMECSS